MASAKHLLTAPIALASFAASFLAVGRLIVFLSQPVRIGRQFVWLLNLLDDESRLTGALLPLCIDALLAILFVLQHSLMRTGPIRSLWQRLGLATVERSLYNIGTAITLHVVVSNWRSVPQLMLWNVDVHSSPALWRTFVGVHALAWSVIFGGSILMDLPELLGVKQVFYDVRALLAPMLYKSDELKRLYGHVRHPSFVGLTVILWSANAMSADRLLLAVLWTAYMFVAWNTDDDDVMYNKCQLSRKRGELSADASQASRSSAGSARTRLHFEQ